MARPMPRLPPVTKACRPSSRVIVCSGPSVKYFKLEIYRRKLAGEIF
jgi:hypothetical protein